MSQPRRRPDPVSSAPRLVLPDAPALLAGAGRATLLTLDGELLSLSPAELAPRLRDLLPPLLVHASEAEMLRDDSRRYVNKAIAAGSPVTLQTWHHMVHVWQIYHPELPEGREAMEEIGKFLRARS